MSDANLARLVVSLEAKIDTFEKSLDKAKRASYGAAGEIKKSLDQVDSRWGTLFGKTEPGKALDNVFSRSRLAVIEEGAAKIPLFGSAIEALGPVGLAAAGGLAALAVTMERTEKAVEFAAGIAKLAQTIGVSTDFIQEFNFAARQSEVDVGRADEALKNLNASLGLVQSGLARKQLANAFKAAGFTPEQLRQFHDVGDFLPVLIDRISQTGSAAEQAAIARRLGIEELIPMLKAGAGGFEELTRKARDLGIVMDASAIRGAEEAKKKLNELDDVMKTKSMITFAEFSGTLISIKEGFLGAEKAALRFLAAVTNTTPLAERLADLEARRAAVASGVQNYGVVDKERLAELDREIAVLKMHQGLQDLMNAPSTPSAAASARALIEPSAKKPKKGKAPKELGADFLETPFDPLTGAKIKPKTPEEEWHDLIFGDNPKPLKLDAEVDLKPTLNEEWAATQKQLSDGVHTAWSEGLNAALNGHFFDWLKQKLMASALEGLADALTKITLQEASQSGIRSVLSVLGIPGFAGGTSYAPGGMAWVGENGPELVNLPKGSQVVPAGGFANGVRGGATIHVDMRGAVVMDELWNQVTRYADGTAQFHAGIAARTAKAETLGALGKMRGQKMGR